ncbi:phage tail tube protein [Streptococcus mutans]|nr:phage tail tube protein [Streptococcus mutans]MCB5031947.1 phage tail tube protein [Streptococcus mutans]
MANKIQGKRQMNGTFGAIWVNGEKWVDVNKFSAKATPEYEDVTMSEDLGMHKKYMGWVGEGEIEVKKIYSRGAALMADAIKTGIMPDITIVGKLDDPDAFGAERISISEITMNEFTLLEFEMKSLAVEEFSFNFADFEFIDKVSPQ